VVGGGDAAFENALILAETAETITLVHRRKDFRARQEFVEKVKNHPKIAIITESSVQKILGKARVTGVEIKNQATGKVQTLPVDSILIRIGVQPNTDPFSGKLKMDKNDYIEVNSRSETSINGVFAIGDVANPVSPTISSAIGMGATAAKGI